MSYTLIGTGSIYSMYTITHYYVCHYCILMHIVIFWTVFWYYAGVSWYITVWLWWWSTGYARTTYQIRLGPTLWRTLLDTLVSWGAMGWGYNASQYQTQTIQVHTRLSPKAMQTVWGDYQKSEPLCSSSSSKALHIHVWSSAFSKRKQQTQDPLLQQVLVALSANCSLQEPLSRVTFSSNLHC